jgi:hypothetical protein
MKAIAFDTLEFAEQLKAADFTDLQAKALAKAVAAIVDEQLATKRDLEELKVGLTRELREMELRLKHDLTMRLGGMIAASVAIVAALVKLL